MERPEAMSAVGGSNVSSEEAGVVRAGVIEVRVKPAAANGNDVREGHLEQPFGAARHPEAAPFHTTERHARIGGRHDEIINHHEATLDLRGERSGLRDIASKDRDAEPKVGGVGTL